MAGNTFGRVFTVTSFGESHGPAIGCASTDVPGPRHLQRRHSERS